MNDRLCWQKRKPRMLSHWLLFSCFAWAVWSILGRQVGTNSYSVELHVLTLRGNLSTTYPDWVFNLFPYKLLRLSKYFMNWKQLFFIISWYFFMYWRECEINEMHIANMTIPLRFGIDLGEILSFPLFILHFITTLFVVKYFNMVI